MHNSSKICLSDAPLHTTEMGAARIRRNLGLAADADVVRFCRDAIYGAEIIHHGKNYYATHRDLVITINATSFTIITAHKIKQPYQRLTI